MSLSITSRPTSGHLAKAAGLLLAALLLTSTLSGVVTPATVQATSGGSLSQQLRSLRSELQEVRENIKKAEVARKAALGDLAALDQNVEYAQAALDAANAAHEAAAAELAKLRAQLEQLAADLDSNQQELTKTENDLRKQEEVLNERVVSVYKSGGNLEYLAAFIGADSLSLTDVVERVDFVSTIAEQDAILLEQIKSLKARVEAKRRQLEATQARVALLEQEQAAVTEELKAAADQCQASLDGLEAARAAKKAAIAALDKDQAAWARQEDQLLAESEGVALLLRGGNSVATGQAGKGTLKRPLVGEVTSGFGYRIHPIFQVRKLHTGIDIDCEMGDSIRAAANGTVVAAGWRGGYGQCVIIAHNGELATLYAHQSAILVSVGQTVKGGEVIGKVGSTGYSTGPHLHFEVRVNGSPVDPMGYLQ